MGLWAGAGVSEPLRKMALHTVPRRQPPARSGQEVCGAGQVGVCGRQRLDSALSLLCGALRSCLCLRRAQQSWMSGLLVLSLAKPQPRASVSPSILEAHYGRPLANSQMGAGWGRTRFPPSVVPWDVSSREIAQGSSLPQLCGESHDPCVQPVPNRHALDSDQLVGESREVSHTPEPPPFFTQVWDSGAARTAW